jgi:phenylacetate-CoA ligase
MMNRRFYANYDLNDMNMARIRGELERYRPGYIRGMASSLYLFSRFLVSRGQRLDRGAPRVVFSACEQLYDWERSTIADALNARVANTYGLSEFGEIAFEAPCGSFHTMDEDVLVELLPLEADPALKEVVVTQLNNLSSPLIRYRTGDIAVSLGQGCACGRGLGTLNGLSGRAHDFVVTPDGRYVHGQFFTHLLVFEKGVSRYQVTQEDHHHFRITIVRCDGYDTATEVRVRAGVHSHVGQLVQVTFEYVDMIPLTSAGKHRWIISKVGDRSRHSGNPSTPDVRP